MSPVVKRLGAIALLAASFTVAALVIRFQPLVEQEIRSLGLSAYPLAIAIFSVVASAPFSVTDALAIMNGVLFGPVKGSIVNAIGLVFAALIGYWINRHASQMLDVDAYLARVPKWVRRFPVGSPAFLIAVRMIPGFGGTVATASAATFRVPLWVHVWTMCIVAIPICTVLAIFGDRVSVVVHQYEYRAHVYWEEHHLHIRFHHNPKLKVKVIPTP
ncbi:MAG TPA: VTT domain-containing protein [Candidatus Aquilonibacter sp.]